MKDVGRTLAHVLVSGLLAQALQFICLYLALMHGAPAVLLQNSVALLPVAALATVMPFTVVDPWKAAGAVACWLNARGSRQQRQHDPAGDGRGQHRVDPVHDPAVTG